MRCNLEIRLKDKIRSLGSLPTSSPYLCSERHFHSYENTQSGAMDSDWSALALYWCKHI